MANILCSQCNSVINSFTCSSSAPPWCPICGGNFKAASNAPAPTALASVIAASPVRSDPVPLPPLPPDAALPAVAPSAASGTVPAGPSDEARPSVPLPPGVPPEVAALGNPEQVHAPDEAQIRRNLLLFRGLCGSGAVLFLGIAGFQLFLLSKPPSANLPPRDALLAIAIGAGVLALLQTVIAFLFTGTRWGRSCWGPRTYLVYPDVLVELRAGRHRIIPWEKIGPQKETSPLLVSYCFSVQDGKPLGFDNTVAGHEALCQTIKERRTDCRLTFGSPSDLAEMTAARPGFHFLATRFGQGRGTYWITLLGKKLLFHRMTAGIVSDRPSSAPTAVAGAVVGGLINGFNAWAATQELPRLFASAVHRTVVWSHSQCKFVGQVSNLSG